MTHETNCKLLNTGLFELEVQAMPACVQGGQMYGAIPPTVVITHRCIPEIYLDPDNPGKYRGDEALVRLFQKLTGRLCQDCPLAEHCSGRPSRKGIPIGPDQRVAVFDEYVPVEGGLPYSANLPKIGIDTGIIGHTSEEAKGKFAAMLEIDPKILENHRPVQENVYSVDW